MAELTDLLRESGSPCCLTATAGDGPATGAAGSACSIRGRLVERPLAAACSPNPQAPLDTPGGCRGPAAGGQWLSCENEHQSRCFLSSMVCALLASAALHRPAASAGFKGPSMGVSLRLHGAKPIGVVGASACGKTPLCRAVAGLLPVAPAVRCGARQEPGAPFACRELQGGPGQIQDGCSRPLACLNPAMGRGRSGG